MKKIKILSLTIATVLFTVQFGFSQINKPPNTFFVKQPTKAKVPVTAGLGAVVLTGVGIMSGGLITWNNGSENVDLYTEHIEPSDDFYLAQDITRDAFMEDSDAQVTKGKIFTFGGVAIVAIAGGTLINRIVKLNKINKGKVSINPYVNPSFKQGEKMNYGLSFSATF